MTIVQFVGVLRRHIVVVLAAFAVTIAAALASLAMQTPTYRSTATLELRLAPTVNDPTGIVSQAKNIAPVYATAVQSAPLQAEAQKRMGDLPLGRIATRTYETLNFKVDAFADTPERAQRSAVAVTTVLLEKVDKGEIGLPQMKLAVVAPASLPTAKESPNPKVTLGVAVLLGFVLGSAVALLRENLRRTVDSADEVSSTAGVPVLGEYYRDRAADEIQSPVAVVSSEQYRALAESARVLRTNLKLDPNRLNVIAVTSPEGRHGKTTVAFTLAAVLARSGVPTLLVDADFDDRRVSKTFGIEVRAGLTDILGGARIPEAVVGTDLNMLHVLAAGRPTAAASDLLERAFPAVPSLLSEYYRAVVIDCPSLSPGNDARVVSSNATHTLLVVRDGGVTRRALKAATSRLSILSIPISAVVLTQARRRQLVG